MCGRYSLKKDPSEFLRQMFPGINFDPDFVFQPNGNICPTVNSPVVINARGIPFCTLLRWGLIPSWSREEKPGIGMINARSETIELKPTFKASFKRRRCVIPADSFYEWKKTPEGKKVPFNFHQKDLPCLLFAGIWDEWERPAALLRTYAILTTSANDSISDIHERMPVILSENRAKEWLRSEEDTSSFSTFFDPVQLPHLDREETSITI